ncbi:serine carboxypeptidase [Mycena olivaceomarginata]|nr:serine carboxypeptidase [Mycena olivaceomarginata]
MTFIQFLRPFTVLPAVFGLRVSSMDEQQVLGFSGIEREAMSYEHVSHPSFSDYSLRLKTPTLCDDSVKQYSGYLDIAEDKHLFFWFFESRSSPASDPLVLWLNGGAGCSSMTGLLFELGPCNINKTEGGTVFTSHNPHAWNNNANVIFLDQPVMTGYSFSSNKTTHVKTTPEAARDEYAMQPFHIAAESYGGHFAPHIASILVHAPSAGLRKINLASIMLGNALTDPLIQMPSVVEYACDSPLAVFSPKSPQCRSLRTRGSICERMISACYALDTRAVCAPATFYCWSMWTVLAEAKRNFHDIRMPCETNPDCYAELNWMTEYMNRRGLVPELVDEGIRLLGNSKWVAELPSTHKEAFGNAPFRPWIVSGRPAGVVRSTGDGAGNVTYLTVFEAGHMVPHDQPEAALVSLS